MKAEFKAINVLEVQYINLSEQLRKELELKIEALYAKDRFRQYTGSPVVNYKNVTGTDFLCAYLIGRAPRNYVLSGKLLQGIKIWFNMYYDDRLSVIDKFSVCFEKVKPNYKPEVKPGITLVFCKFLINELLSILAENRWQMLIIQAN